jgi:hypothetical protein
MFPQIRNTVVVALLAFVLGCASTSDPENSRTREEYLGLPVPLQVGQFSRINFVEHELRSEGAGIGASYQARLQSTLLVTIYVFPSPRRPDGTLETFANHFLGERAGVLQYSAGSSSIAWPNSFVNRNDEDVESRHEAFQLPAEDGVPKTSLLHLFDYGERRLKFRMTYDPRDRQAELLARKFHEDFPFP